MLEFIIEMLAYIPTDIEMDRFIAALKSVYIKRLFVVNSFMAFAGFIVYKTPWKWDNKLWAWFKSKLPKFGKGKSK